MLQLLPEYTYAIDPGESVGIARTYEHPATYDTLDLSHYYAATTVQIGTFEEQFERSIQTERVDLIIVEEYRIYPDKAQMHIGQPLITAELIGAIKWMAKRQDIPLVEQPAGIKATTAAVLKGRGFKSIGNTLHARDAEKHLWYYVLNGKGSQSTNKRK